MITALDTNILLDLLIPNAPHAQASKNALDLAYRQGALVIYGIVYAELASRFTSQTSLEDFLGETGIRMEASNQESLYAAANAWELYLARRGPTLQCPQCGDGHTFDCSNCGSPIRIRQHILSDFIIGGHASHQADQLLTRDRGYYRTYFPNLPLQS